MITPLGAVVLLGAVLAIVGRLGEQMLLVSRSIGLAAGVCRFLVLAGIALGTPTTASAITGVPTSTARNGPRAFSLGSGGAAVDRDGLRGGLASGKNCRCVGARVGRASQGKEHDELTSLSYFGFRYYDRLTLTWTQADPLYRFVPDLAWDEPRRANLYSFVMNNPLRYIDPDGLDKTDKDFGKDCTPSKPCDKEMEPREVTAGEATMELDEETRREEQEAEEKKDDRGWFRKYVFDPGNPLDWVLLGGGTKAKMAGKGGKEVVKGGRKILGGIVDLVRGKKKTSKAARTISWSSSSVRRAAGQLDRGATSVRVGNRSEAEEIFLRRYQGHGYRNTTGMSPTEAKNFHGSKAGTYHWDTGQGAYPHDASHLQIHTFDGDVVRIYFPD